MRTWHSLVPVAALVLALTGQWQAEAAGLGPGQVVLVRGTVRYDVRVSCEQSAQPASRVSHDTTYLTRYRVLQTAAGRVTKLRAYIEAATDIVRGEDGLHAQVPVTARYRELTIAITAGGTPVVTNPDGQRVALDDAPELLGMMALIWPGTDAGSAPGQVFTVPGEALPGLLGLDPGATAQVTATVQPKSEDSLLQSVSLAVRAEQTMPAMEGKYLITLDGDYQFDAACGLPHRLLLEGTVSGTAAFGPAESGTAIAVAGPVSMRFDYFGLRD